MTIDTCHDDVASAYLEAIAAELTEIGAYDLLPYVTAARQRDEVAIAVVAAYVAERDAQLAHGRSRKWLVTGGRAPRLGACFATRSRAEAYAERWGARAKPGYGNRYGWSAISAEWCEHLAEHAMAVQAAHARVAP